MKTFIFHNLFVAFYCDSSVLIYNVISITHTINVQKSQSGYRYIVIHHQMEEAVALLEWLIKMM